MHVDLADLGFDRGGSLLVKQVLGAVPEGEAITVCGEHSDLYMHLRAWCRAEGHEILQSDADQGCAVILKGSANAQRWSGAERAGRADSLAAAAIVDHPPQRWGLAAAAAQWDPATR